MAKIYKTITISCCCILSIALSSCETSRTYLEAMNKNESKIDDSNRLKDAQFVVDARSFNMLEIRLAEDAITKGYSSAVVDLARTMLADHMDMKKDIETLARKERFALPTIMSNDHMARLNEVTNTQREDFDQDFINTMKRINDENTEQYLKMATDASDDDVRAFAARKLDMLRAHSTKMQETEKKLMNTY